MAEAGIPGGRGSNIPAAERRVKAAELRAAGLSYRQIATQLGISPMTAHKDVRKALAALHDDLKGQARELFAQEWQRLEMPVLPLAKAVKDGDVAAVLVWIKLSESRRKLAGLDEPAKHEVSTQLPGILVLGGVDADAALGVTPEVDPEAPPPAPATEPDGAPAD